MEEHLYPSYSNSIHIDLDESFTDEQLLAIDAIESACSAPGISSSSSPTLVARSKELSTKGKEDASKKIRRKLPRSISSASYSEKFSLSRCQESQRSYPAMRFGGKILYSTTGKDVDKAARQLMKILGTMEGEPGRAAIGLDIEWKPSFRKGVLPGKVAVLQICVDHKYCHVMHIIHSGVPKSLQSLLEESVVPKVGIGIDGDSVKLFHDYGISIKNVEDLSDLANKKLGGSRKWGLASLTETLVCKELLKPKKIRLGNWETRFLSKEQLQYAATDAFASWHLYQVLKNLPDVVEDELGKRTGDTEGLPT